jgi:hypothetical protein
VILKKSNISFAEGGSTEREGIVVVEARFEISVRAIFAKESRALVSREECKPAPKSWMRQDMRLYVETRNVGFSESIIGRRSESSFNIGRK